MPKHVRRSKLIQGHAAGLFWLHQRRDHPPAEQPRKTLECQPLSAEYSPVPGVTVRIVGLEQSLTHPLGRRETWSHECFASARLRAQAEEPPDSVPVYIYDQYRQLIQIRSVAWLREQRRVRDTSDRRIRPGDCCRPGGLVYINDHFKSIVTIVCLPQSPSLADNVVPNAPPLPLAPDQPTMRLDSDFNRSQTFTYSASGELLRIQ